MKWIRVWFILRNVMFEVINNWLLSAYSGIFGVSKTSRTLSELWKRDSECLSSFASWLLFNSTYFQTRETNKCAHLSFSSERRDIFKASLANLQTFSLWTTNRFIYLVFLWNYCSLLTSKPLTPQLLAWCSLLTLQFPLALKIHCSVAVNTTKLVLRHHLTV